MSEQKILRDTAQTLLSYPRLGDSGEVLRQVPASVTVKIGTPAESFDETTSYAAGTVDAVSTTLSAAVDEGATSLTIASAAIRRGRRYLVADGAGGFVDVESRSEGTLTTMQLAEPLPRALASGAAVRGFACSIALTTAQTDLVGNGIAEWRATMSSPDSRVLVWTQGFRIVRRLLLYTLTPTRLTQAWPAIQPLRTRQDVDLEETISATWAHRILPLLAAKGIDEDDVVGADALEPLHALACLMQLLLPNPSTAGELFDRLERRWAQLEETTFSRKDWWQVPQDQTPQPRPEDQLRPAMGTRLVR